MTCPPASGLHPPSISLLRITGGALYDPRNGIDGEVRDLWIEDGRIRTAPDEPRAAGARTLDATGMVIMPGGVDMH